MSASENPVSEVVWSPDARTVESARLTAFMRTVGIEEQGAAGYERLLRFAADEPERFWDAVIRFSDIRFFQAYSRVLDTSDGIEWAHWCVGGTTNVVLNCLDRHLGTPREAQAALVWEGEDGTRRSLDYRELSAEVCRAAAGLAALGVGVGDVVGLYLPMIPEAAVALLAVAKIGAIVLPLFSGFGPPAIATRLNDGGAVAVITADATWRRGRPGELKTVLDEAVKSVPSLRNVIVVRHAGTPIDWQQGRDVAWTDMLAMGTPDFPTTVMPADAPMMLVHTSGTTGKPKGTVHTHCGFMTKMALDLGICMDYRAGDRLMWMSDMGWLVGPVLVIASTLVGGTMVLAEGAPDYPDESRYWRLVRDHEVTLLGIAPTIVRSLMQAGGAGIERFTFPSLRLVLSTGEAWTPDAWHWLFEHVCRRRLPILNYSGGTEVGGGILTGTPLHPLKPCAFAGPIPGCGADLVDDSGRSVTGAGVGELVMRQPSIGMTRGLWRDAERYLDTYWRQVPGLWWHGDRAARDADGFWYIHGRSDDTLKIAGKRTGPSEIEGLVMATGRFAEVAAIGVPDAIKGEVAVIVGVPLPGVPADATLVAEVGTTIVRDLGPPFRPAAVLFVSDLPKTRNMKIMRRVVKAVYLAQDPGDLSSLVNPGCLETLAAARNAAATKEVPA